MSKDGPAGIFLIDKPQGLTSHDVVDIVRRKLKIKRVGHGGTLDPLATGLLVVLVGRATKLFSRMSALDKEYEATLKLGVATDSGDAQGRIVYTGDYQGVSFQDIERAFSKFKGEVFQVPPMISAIRFRGRRLYEWARKGKEVERKARKVNIYSLEIEKLYLPFIDFRIFCSKGTYIRKLVQDIGEELGCGAHITRIRRLRIGPFSIKEAINIEEIDESLLKSPTLFKG